MLIFVLLENEAEGQIPPIIQLINMLKLPVKGYFQAFKGAMFFGAMLG